MMQNIRSIDQTSHILQEKKTRQDLAKSPSSSSLTGDAGTISCSPSLSLATATMARTFFFLDPNVPAPRFLHLSCQVFPDPKQM